MSSWAIGGPGWGVLGGRFGGLDAGFEATAKGQMQGDAIFNPGMPGTDVGTATVKGALLTFEHIQKGVYALLATVVGHPYRLLGSRRGSIEAVLALGQKTVHCEQALHSGQGIERGFH